MCDVVLSKVLQEGKKPKKVKKEKKPLAENAFCERPTLFESCFPLKTTQRTWGYNIKQTQCGAQPSSISHTSQAFGVKYQDVFFMVTLLRTMYDTIFVFGLWKRSAFLCYGGAETPSLI